MKREDIVIFHYHVRSGGVTSVILLSIRAIAAELPEVRRIRLVVGEEPDARLRSVLSSIAAGAGAPRVEIETVPELRYTLPGQKALPDPDGLSRLLVERWGGALWWVHNYHLGKNPPFTQALLSVAGERAEQRILFHIHDLPEAGRLENLKELHRSVTLPLYPALPNVRYLVINEQDRRLLVEAGLPGEIVFLLHNPVSSQPLPAVDSRQVRERLAESFGREFPGYSSGSPILLYPVRTIRRKNVLEAGLLSALSPDAPNLVVTLPGISPRELGYSRAIEERFRRGIVKGLWGIGDRLPEAGLDFPALAASADRLVSTSLQEGFGYLFVDSLRWRKPLVARRLDILDGIADLLSSPAVRLYEQLLVPIDPAERAELLAAYDRSIDDVEGALIHPDALRAAIRSRLTREAADFSFLPLEAQSRVIEASGDPGVRAELVRMNARLLEGLDRMAAPAAALGEAVERRFGFPSYAAALREILGSFDRVSIPAGAQGEDVHRRLCAASEVPENFRLLLA